MPTASPDPCSGVVGAAQQVCEGHTGSGHTGAGTGPVGSTLDPLSAFAKSCAGAASWTAKELGKVIRDHNAVDITNSGFLTQYAIVFAASVVLVLVLWLLAVAKRAIRGVPIGTAMGEAVGLLWLAVLATAFTPLALYVLIGAVTAVSDVLVHAMGGQPGGIFVSLGADLSDDRMGGGPVIQIIASLATILLCGALWLLMVLRTLGLYVGAVLGVVVYAGLVDKDLWGHVRRWAGVMVALILVQPITVIVLGLAAAVQSSDTHGSVVNGLAITLIALGISVQLIRSTPGYGDAVKLARATGRAAGGVLRGADRAIGGPAADVQRGIDTHGRRAGGQADGAQGTQGGAQRPANPLSGGIAADGRRQPKGGGVPPQQLNGSGTPGAGGETT